MILLLKFSSLIIIRVLKVVLYMVKMLEEYVPFWRELSPTLKELLCSETAERLVSAGTVLHGGKENCTGLLIVTSGRIRAYTVSEEGKELTLYRLYDRDICLFSASCVFSNVSFDIFVEAEQDTRLLHIPSEIYRRVMESSAPAAVYTNKLMSERFYDVMWLLDQVMNKRLDTRLAALLLEERDNCCSDTLNITHEKLGNHLGSVREVITRMLRHFQDDGLVLLKRGSIELVDIHRLEELAAASQR